MGLFDFLKPAEITPPPTHLPLLPLKAVLFPGGRLPVHVTDVGALDLATRALRENHPIGIALVRPGNQTPTQPIGCEATIESADISVPGTLDVVLRGHRRFRITAFGPLESGAGDCQVDWLADDAACPVPEAQAGTVPLLQSMVAGLEPGRVGKPLHFNDCSWVSNRFSELLDIPLIAKQRLMELEDPVSRLEIIFRYLAQRQLVT